ncbi:hypothetical protein ACFPRL_33380 [Pseudoclavibacter helvolus]
MVQRREVSELDGRGGRDDVVRARRLTELRCEHGEHGAQALAAGVEQVTGGHVGDLVGVLHLGAETSLDRGQSSVETLAQHVGLRTVEEVVGSARHHGASRLTALFGLGELHAHVSWWFRCPARREASGRTGLGVQAGVLPVAAGALLLSWRSCLPRQAGRIPCAAQQHRRRGCGT